MNHPPRIDLFDLRPDDARAEAFGRDLRTIEALLFTSTAPLAPRALAPYLSAGADLEALMETLAADYAGRGVNLARVAGGYMLRTAPEVAAAVAAFGAGAPEPRKLSRAAVEVLAIIAYHQPVTRAKIEEIRGVSTSRGTLDVLLETGWVRLRGRRKAPGRPVTYGTTPGFLVQFGLDAVTDLPGLDELRGAGLLDARLGTGFSIPLPSDDPLLRPDEEALEPEPLDFTLAPLPAGADDER